MELIKKYISCFIILFTIIDIIGNIPTIINFKKNNNIINSKKSSLTSLFIFLFFLFFGQIVLKSIGLNESSFAIAGSIIIFIISIEMISGIQFNKNVNKNINVSIVPIAFPLIAGPGALATLISLRLQYNINIIITNLFINIFIVFLVLKNSDLITKKISDNGLNIIKKIFGVLLLSFSIKMFNANI